jgi:hypothetical protein
MAFHAHRRFVLLLAFTLASEVAYGLPLTGEAAASSAAERERPSDAQVLDTPLWAADPAPIHAVDAASPLIPGARGDAPSSPGGFRDMSAMTIDGGSSSVVDAFRSLVNLNPRASEGAANAVVRRGGPAEQDFVMAGTALQDWADDAVRGLVNSAVELRVDEQGRATFSVLGMGDFGIVVSGDRNEVALLSGLDVLFTANRSPQSQVPGYGGTGSGYGPGDPRPAARPIDTTGGSPVHQALELLSEIATHPISLLVYLVIGAYVVLWQVMSATRHTRAQPLAGAAMPAPASPRRRSPARHRFRRSRRRAA